MDATLTTSGVFNTRMSSISNNAPGSGMAMGSYALVRSMILGRFEGSIGPWRQNGIDARVAGPMT